MWWLVLRMLLQNLNPPCDRYYSPLGNIRIISLVTRSLPTTKRFVNYDSEIYTFHLQFKSTSIKNLRDRCKFAKNNYNYIMSIYLLFQPAPLEVLFEIVSLPFELINIEYK